MREKDRDLYLGPEEPAPRRRRYVVLLAAFAITVVLLAVLRVGSPELTLDTDRPGIGPRTVVIAAARAAGRGLAGLRLELEQGDQMTVLAERAHRPRPFWALWGKRVTEDELRAEVGAEVQPGLESGEATLRLVAERAGSFLRRPPPVVLERVLPVRLRPPAVAVLTPQVYLAQGGSAAVVYRVDGDAERDGVEAGGFWFPGYPLPGSGAGERFALFAAPWDLEQGSEVRVVAVDELGNRMAVPCLYRYQPNPPRESTIELDDDFIARVVPAIAAQSQVVKRGSLLDTYLVINRDLRRSNDTRLHDLAASTRPAFLWRRPFLQQPNTQVMDAFASRREYRYQGKPVDRQTHLGYDLASRRRDPVAAANRGVVVLAEYLGIYGNAVVLDHGYGLMSLYAHLSSLDVKLGDEVERGAVLGRSGETGLAGGDHLHFSVLVHGVPVDPVEWWDGKWIADRIAAPLGGALALER